MICICKDDFKTDFVEVILCECLYSSVRSHRHKNRSLNIAMRKMKQAIGRLIRTETDRGMAVIMDNRVARYAKELEAVPTDDVLMDTAKFFEGMD